MIKNLALDDIDKLFNLIAKEYLVLSPQENQGVVAFGPKKKFDKISLYPYQTIMPPKISLLENVYDLETTPSPEKIAFLGIHLCDIQAIKILDKVFRKDPFYRTKRDNSLIVATECQPTNNCFCQVFGANQHANFDLFIQTEENNRYLVFAKTEKGVGLLERICSHVIHQADYHPIGNTGPDFDLKELTRKIDNRSAHENHWQSVANNCFGCGACTAVCPLCFCFDVIDRTDISAGKCHRSRSDDSCFFPNFSKIHNHDFRANNVDRLYNWYHHKFVRGPKNPGDYLCVGCGRCITACPANLNIKKILSTINS